MLLVGDYSMEKIDFVITWVDNADKEWQERKKNYSNKNGLEDSSIRYRDYGTLKYVFRSIEKYTPWVNKVYLVTDHQTPDWLNIDNPTVKVVDHNDFIDSKYLPLFNSNAIEWNIDKIPNLKERFVYFNDDTLINRPLNKEDFFYNGNPKDFRLYTDIVPTEEFNHIVLNNGILINKFVKGRWPISKKGLWNSKYGVKRIKNLIFLPQIKKSGISGYVESHGPLAFKRSSFRRAREIWPNQISMMNTHRFRSIEDISIWLVRHLQLELGDFEPTNSEINYFNDIAHLKDIKIALQKEKSNFICINDINVDDYEKTSHELKEILNNKFPVKSYFEK